MAETLVRVAASAFAQGSGPQGAGLGGTTAGGAPIAAELPPLPRIDLLDVMLSDPTMILMGVAMLLLLPILWYKGRKGQNYLKRNVEFLDHQQSATERNLDINDEMQRMVKEQYARTNAYNDEALAKAEAALALHREALDQLALMNRTMSELARRLDTREAGGHS